MSVRDKQRRHQAHLNSLFLLHNLNNNGGVISQLMGEAQEQVGGGQGCSGGAWWGRGPAKGGGLLNGAVGAGSERVLGREDGRGALDVHRH